jgi:iron complex outermembrane receptor protein
MQIAGGPLAIAVGADLRREEISDRAVNADYGRGLNVGGEGTVPNTDASRNVIAVFTELSIPVTKTVELSAAVRWDHYSDVGSKANPRFAARWNPTKEVLLRASAGTGFRVPSLWDLHSAPSFGNSANSLLDPGCPAALIADGDARCVDTQLNTRNIASPNLKPETSRQWSMGFLVEPLQGISLGLDYWQIKKKDQIGTVSADIVLANPDDLTLYNRYISRFVRSAAGTTLYFDQPLENLGDLKTAGFDLDAKWRFNPGFAKATVSLAGTYLTEWKIQQGVGFPFVSYLGNSFNGGNAYPRWSHVAALDLERGPWLFTVENTYTRGWTEAFAAGGTHWIDSVSRWNLGLKFTGLRNIALKLGVKNVADKLPPYTDVSSNGSHAAGFPNAVASPLGRYWYGVATYSFK